MLASSRLRPIARCPGIGKLISSSGPGNSRIVTLVERHTRFASIERLPGVRDSAMVIDVVQHQIMDLPGQIRQNLRWDQGQEMSGHRDFRIATGCPAAG